MMEAKFKKKTSKNVAKNLGFQNVVFTPPIRRFMPHWKVALKRPYQNLLISWYGGVSYWNYNHR